MLELFTHTEGHKNLLKIFSGALVPHKENPGWTCFSAFHSSLIERKTGRPASRDLRSIVRSRALGTRPSFKALHCDQIPSWCLILDQEQVYTLNMFLGTILMEKLADNAWCTFRLTGTRRKSPNNSLSIPRPLFCATLLGVFSTPHTLSLEFVGSLILATRRMSQSFVRELSRECMSLEPFRGVGWGKINSNQGLTPA